MPVVVEVDADELEGMGLALELHKRDIDRAVRVAAARTARWAQVQVARGLASRLGVPQSAVAGRRLKAKTGKTGARVWIALNPLNAAKAGARETQRGLRAGRQDFHGAFMIKGKRGGRAAVQRRGRARVPLEAASLDVLGAAPDEITRKTWPALNERFLAFYAEELARRSGG